MDLLASEGSGNCMVHKELGLTRAIIKGTLKSLDHSRRLQMVFANISCGTFFKYYDAAGNRQQVKCPLCEEPCSLTHLQNHLPMENPDPENEEELVEYLSSLTELVAPSSTVIPIPLQDGTKYPQPATPERSETHYGTQDGQ